ncbi:hypothetical protein [Streptomyces sp. NPDC014734]|uniref:hypothetical protein n=1 Tax=Streptomyces sp. NPDC014734 TaxID=3364886 RepID=UPI0036F74B08
MVQKPESDTEPKERRIDLSLPQVAGSAVAAVAAAVAASQLGVYGTVIGAGVMSVVATCGGSVFQHFFRRTGEQIREVTVQVKHQDRETTVRTRETVRTPPARGGRRSAAPGRAVDATMAMPVVDATTAIPAVDATTAMPAVDGTSPPHGTDPTTVLRAVGTDPDRTRPVPLDATRSPAAVRPVPDEEFSEATTHGTRLRGWKRPALGAAVVFAVSMAGITTYELIAGNDLSGGRGTTVGSVVRGGGERGAGPEDHAPSTGTDPARDRTPDGESGATPGTDTRDGQSRNPDSGGGGNASADPEPGSTPSGGTGTGPTPAATPSPSAPGDGGAAPDPTGTGDTPAQGDRATTGPSTAP